VIDDLSKAVGRAVSRETFNRIEAYIDLLREEGERQNLVSAATLGDVWNRHIIDSAQLTSFEPFPGAAWVDLGAGAGLPGVVIACLVDGPVTLVEPRRLRADFLHRVVKELRLGAVVVQSKAEALRGTYDVITARAVASLGRLLEISHHLSTGKTVWILPKGRSAVSELAETQKTWQGVFHVERSITDGDSRIVVATGVRARSS